MNLQCPYQAIVNHVNGFQFPWDYLVHLQKCHVINEQILKRQANEFFFCPSCMQVFERQTERNNHLATCKSSIFRHLLRDVNQGIRLGVQASQKLESIMKFYAESVKAPQTKMQLEHPQLAMRLIPRLLDPRGPPPPAQQVDTNNMRTSTQLTVELGPDKIRLRSADYTILNPNCTSIKIVNQSFDHKINNEVLKRLLFKYGLPFSFELLKNNRVCSFVEEQFQTLYPNDDVFYSIRHPGQGLDIIWFIMNEQNQEFQSVIPDPWCIFAIQAERNISLDQQLRTRLDTQLEFLIIQSHLKSQVQECTQIEYSIRNLQLLLGEEAQLSQVDFDRYNKLAQQQSIQQAKFIKSQTEYFSKEIQLTDSAKEQLTEGLSLLEALFLHQKNKLTQEYIESQKSEQLSNTNALLNKEQAKTLKRLQERQEITQQVKDKQAKLKSIQDQLEAAKMRSSFGKQTGHQTIDLYLCIECKTAPRSVIQSPCRHFLFCEPCYITLLSRPAFTCPLSDIGQCKQDKIDKKYKIIHL